MTFRRQSAAPFASTPHGLWTLDCPYGARVLLGWLHSHQDDYLARLSHASIARLLGTSASQVRIWCEHLARLGFLEVIAGAQGEPNRIVLTDAYWTLGRIETIGTLTETIRGPESKRSGDPDRNDHAEEEHLEQQVEELSLVALAAPEPVVEFEDFWRVYPLKRGKGPARKKWERMTRAERAAALAAVPRHVAYWERTRVEPKFIPHPTTWLNGERWSDDLAMPATRRASDGTVFDPDLGVWVKRA